MYFNSSTLNKKNAGSLDWMITIYSYNMLLTWYLGGWVEKHYVFCIRNDVTLQRESFELSFLFGLFSVICCRAAVDSGKCSGLCVSGEMLLILGGWSFFSAGCHGNISARTQSNAWMCVRDRREPRNIPHTLLSSVLVDMQQQISVHHALHPVSLASSLLLIFLFLHHCLSLISLLYPSRCFHSLLLCSFLMTED